MIFSRCACEQAEGLILAHTLRLAKRLIKKGRVLTAADIHDLKQHGVEYVTGARLEDFDVAEDEAALIIASALAGEGLRIGKPVAGRCNLYAKSPGLVTINRECINAINCCDGAITVATLSPDDEAEAGQTVATIKIIPFAVSQKLLDTCCVLSNVSSAAGSAVNNEEHGKQNNKKNKPAAISIKPFISHNVELILTEADNIKSSVLAATSKVMHQRLESYGSHITHEQNCAHTVAAVEQALKKALLSESELILICGATITVDIGDVVPSAIINLGGVIVHFGMPVEPGNMLLLARHGKKTIINLPGCSRSPKLNGVDWVLQRTLAGMLVTSQDIMLMGVGGLIKDVPYMARKQRAVATVSNLEGNLQGNLQDNLQGNTEEKIERKINSQPEDKTMTPQITAVILAAGLSRRMGEQNKLLTAVGKKTMIEHVVYAALASDAHNVLVVTGHQTEEIHQTLAGYNVSFVYNPDYATGMASSLRTAISALTDDIDAALILLADMPFISARQIDTLIAAFNPNSENDIVVPVREGRRGNPVLWARRYFDEMLILEGDAGARSLLKKYSEHIVEQTMDDDAVFFDIDTPDLLGRLPDLLGRLPDMLRQKSDKS